MQKAKKRRANKYLLIIPLIISIFSIVIVTISFLFSTPPTLPDEPEKPSIPRLDIYLNGVTLSEITDKNIKYQNNSVRITNDSNTYNFDRVELKGHGNTTWIDQAKKPYQIKFNNKVDLFNLGASKKYILLANAFDDTFIRNDIAFYLERLLEEPYALNGKFVELYVDDDYRGLYYLTPKVEIAKNRIDLKHSSGVLVELENMRPEGTTCYYTSSNNCLSLRDISNEEYSEDAMNDFVETFNRLELAVKKHDYNAIDSIADIDDFAKYYLLSEFTVNPDAYATSFYFYKDGPNDKIHVGPGWDFDLALSNHAWYTDYEPFYSPYETQATSHFIYSETIVESSNLPTSSYYSDLIVKLTDIPEFMEKVTEIYAQTMAGHKNDLLDYARTTLLNISDAVAKNSTLYEPEHSFESSANYLLEWLSKRYDYFEYLFGEPTYDPTVTTYDPI